MFKKIILGLAIVMLLSQAYGLELERVKVYFLEGDYKSAISEGEKILAKSGRTQDLDELYYFLGLSYLKIGNYLRASDIFEIILKEFKDSRFKEEAKLGLADTYFLRGDFSRAEVYYQELIKDNPQTKLKAAILYRLSQIGFQKGDTAQAKEYLNQLKTDSPLNAELKLNPDLSGLLNSSDQIYYTVQVGSFANAINAANLRDKLVREGFEAYIQEVELEGKKAYRVKVGKLNSRQDAVQLENKLSLQGYPTRICP